MKIRPGRVFDCDRRRCPYPRLALEHRARETFPEGHVVHMSLDHSKVPTEHSVSVAVCDCGWENRVPWVRGGYLTQDAAVEAHWRDVEAGKISTGNES